MPDDDKNERIDGLLQHARVIDREASLVDLAPLVAAHVEQAAALFALHHWIMATVPDVAVNPAYARMKAQLDLSAQTTNVMFRRFKGDKAAQE